MEKVKITIIVDMNDMKLPIEEIGTILVEDSLTIDSSIMGKIGEIISVENIELIK